MITLSEDRWVQVGGDANPLTYGGTFARLEGQAIEIKEIQPVAEYVGTSEAAGIGYPFWIVGSYHDPERPEDNSDALAFFGLDHTAEPLAVALARHEYGHREECAAGWSDTVAAELPGVFLQAELSEADEEYRCDILGD